ncbi:hypothetical protein GcM3_190012 [Golovinomyces cichoracearum]|uniref:Ubiquitin-like-conjugating enzyme ATG10 n=1 Tax=Golovinomyces cichoracearum TaxID=62708 RepID=A0A420HI45_9PEZI|nr:hypothetical protein GcM3_190012 [Golovinomyces cichoracearum]
MAHHNDYAHWPFVSVEEFELACAYLDQRYIRAKLGKARLKFQLRPRRVVSTGSAYIEILRPLYESGDLNDLSNALEGLKFTDNSRYEREIMLDSVDWEDDEEALHSGELPPKYSTRSSQPYVAYEIHLHPTYRMPILWFNLRDLNHQEESALDIDTVYRLLVAPQYRSCIQSTGITGGISAAPHPVTDNPAFFIHPCQTKEAMEGFDCHLENYLMVWIGIVGGTVGLWLPAEMGLPL